MLSIDELFISGFSIFIFFALLICASYIYYISHGHKIIKKMIKKEKEKGNEHYTIYWLKSQWIFITLFTVCFHFTSLYLSMYFHQGIITRLDDAKIMFERWFVLALVGFLYSICISKLMNHTLASSVLSFDAQSFFMTYYHIFAFIYFLLASLSQTKNTRLLWLSYSIISFVISIVLYFFPGDMNKMQYEKESDRGISVTEHETKGLHKMKYNLLFLVIISVSYVAYFMVWVLSESNKISTLITFEYEVFFYLIVDLFITIVFSLVIIVTTFMNKNKTIELHRKDCSGKNHVEFHSKLI